jgi:CheY-like chemotaxis protein
MRTDSKESRTSLGNKLFVLFVDDSPVDRAYIEGILTKHNIEVVLVESGEEAIKISKDRIPDLILLDILLPKVSGIEVCKKLKAEENLKKVLKLLQKETTNFQMELKKFLPARQAMHLRDFKEILKQKISGYL